MHFLNQAKYLIKTSFSLPWIWKTYLRLRASRGERESSTAAQITVGSHCQHSWEEVFSHTAKVTGRVLSPRKNLLKAVTLPFKWTFIWSNPWQSHEIINLMAKRDQKYVIWSKPWPRLKSCIFNHMYAN